jgi:hypothetical protein
LHIETQSFSASSSESYNDVFSSTYDNYLIKFRSTHSSADTGIFYRLRVGGSDNSTSNYNYVIGIVSGVTIAVQTSLTQTSSFLCSSITSPASADILINSPNLATITTSRTFSNVPASATSPRYIDGQATHNVASAFTGITIFPTSGTISGEISIYGFRK